MTSAMNPIPVHKRREHVPVEPSYWILIFADLFVFSAMFVAYMLGRYESGISQSIFSQGSQSLNQSIGLLNTIILLTSSFFVAQAVRQFRSGKNQPARLSILLALLCGLGFIFCKIYEYIEKLTQGMTVTSSRFFEFYFTFTGVHLLHVVIGTVLLIVIWQQNDKYKSKEGNMIFIEGVGCYWHMVDLLWLMLFTLFYLIN